MLFRKHGSDRYFACHLNAGMDDGLFTPQNDCLGLVGSISLTAHIIILVAMYFQGTHLLISHNLIKYVWYAATTTMLFIIEHAVWLNLLWISAEPGEFSYFLLAAFAGVLLATVSLLVDVVVPVEPDPQGIHALFCILFMVGGSINVFSSLILLPGSAQGVSITYKYVMVGITFTGFAAALSWYLLRLSKVGLDYESALEHISYVHYLGFLLVGIIGARMHSEGA
jgi:hypothetical protein